METLVLVDIFFRIFFPYSENNGIKERDEKCGFDTRYGAVVDFFTLTKKKERNKF